MKKLHLNVETLRVESFVSAEANAQRGTVDGFQIYSYRPECEYTWNPYKATCNADITCGYTG